MTRLNGQRARRVLATLVGLSLVAAACGGSDDTADTGGGSSGKVVIDWWHIQNNDPAKANWQKMADAYMADHPNVEIKITPMENEAYKAALQTNLQAGDVPDLFQSWGGGGLRDQVEAGLLRDITKESADFLSGMNPAATSLYNLDGKQYGVPYSLGIVGFWYNKELFKKAGIDKPPATWDDYLEVVKKLKEADITPIAVGAGDKWPAHFYYSYLMVRIGGQGAMEKIAESKNFNDPVVIEAGEKVAELVALEPFQPGFLAAGWDAPDGESGAMANGQAAMDLMGHWAPGAFKIQAGVEPDADLPFELGWFPFPMVEGGAGKASDSFGGGDGFVVGKDAPPEAVDFLEFITNVDNAKTWGASGSGLPVTNGADVSITDPNMKAVLDGVKSTTFMQIFLDQFFSSEVGGAVNDATQTLFAGTATPEEAAQAITAVAGG